MPGTLMPIKKLNVEIIPPEGAKFFGTTPGGLPIYEQKIVRAGPAEPKLDKDGKEVWVKHFATGEPLYQRFIKKPVERIRYIVPDQQGNGNLFWNEYRFPTPEEAAAKEREKKIAAMRDRLPELLVDKGIDLDNFLSALMAEPKGVAAGEAAQAAGPAHKGGEVGLPRGTKSSVPLEIFPKFLGGKTWQLRDGSKVEGTRREAVKAQTEQDEGGSGEAPPAGAAN